MRRINIDIDSFVIYYSEGIGFIGDTVILGHINDLRDLLLGYNISKIDDFRISGEQLLSIIETPIFGLQINFGYVKMVCSINTAQKYAAFFGITKINRVVDLDHHIKNVNFGLIEKVQCSSSFLINPGIIIAVTNKNQVFLDDVTYLLNSKTAVKSEIVHSSPKIIISVQSSSDIRLYNDVRAYMPNVTDLTLNMYYSRYYDSIKMPHYTTNSNIKILTIICHSKINNLSLILDLFPNIETLNFLRSGQNLDEILFLPNKITTITVNGKYIDTGFNTYFTKSAQH
jgi:hypothetical protein